MRLITAVCTLSTLVCALGSAANAQTAARLSQAMYVEKISESGTTREIEPATNLRKGDRIILMVKWKAAAPGTSFTVSSAIPKKLAYQRSSIRAQAVSVDGGRNWGQIGTLTIRDAYGKRLASVEDVTHLRWKIPASLAAEGNGTLTYSAIVR